MNNTPNINLSTYTSDPNDKFNLLVTFNNNMTKIDTAVGSQNDQIEVIETTASTAVSTANTASATATEALTTAEGKTSVNDNVASTTTTYSSNKINELISGIHPETEIDDSVTSTTKTWSSSKINTEIDAVETIANSKASINDTTASNTTTYSSNKINDLIGGAGGDFPDYNNRVEVANTTTVSSNHELNINYTATEDCYVYARIIAKSQANALISFSIGSVFAFTCDAGKNLFVQTPIFKVKANTSMRCNMSGVDTSGTVHEIDIYKIPIIN